MIRDDATEAQVIAADPGESTWLSANAGSGKTRVLTNRVARLLLEGVEPQNILCLTYTKAAATEMQNRLFKRLGAWAMMGNEKLQGKLQELGVAGTLDESRLSRARTLFALAIETPGGLRIQTIHSFCSTLLRRFPLEAGVSPSFREMEERAAELLRAEILEDMALGEEADLISRLAQYHTGEDFSDLTGEIVRHAVHFANPPTTEQYRMLFDVKEDTRDSITARLFLGNEGDLIRTLCPALAQHGPNDRKAGQKLSHIQDLGFSALPVLESVFLTGSSAKIPFSSKAGSFPTKALRNSMSGTLIKQLDQFMDRVEEARTKRLGLIAAERSEVLHRFAHAFLKHYEARKLTRGWLDFDDLIRKARDLLSNRAVADWVLFRLDGGIDHILVDEAQDTSPIQWQVIERLAHEITSGEGAHADRVRTIFVVGDKKQSIYSFQGADPREFDRMRQDFSERLKDTDTPVRERELAHSFRSAPAILRVVDAIFDERQSRALGDRSHHIAFHTEKPGRVDLWPLIAPMQTEKDGDWFDPVDRKSDLHHNVLLARRIAGEIKRLIEARQPLPTDPDKNSGHPMRPVHAGDFLILVQRRSDLFHEIIRACKSEGLPIAGADRLRVGAELAVRDIAALLSFLATPEDDLSLATVLKSPLFGWSEQQLFDLAHRRAPNTYLWQTLRERREEFTPVLAILNDLRGQTDFLRPYDLIERILIRHDGRRRLISRLGAEAEDGINALLSQALGYEQTEVPSLTGFLVWLDTDAQEIKRQSESAGQKIRVMTVHGAKGLEAPIVILPDCAKRDIQIRDNLLPADQGMIWKPSRDEEPRFAADARQAMVDIQERERMRLLYVALTRAESWLILCAAGDLGKDGRSWYALARAGLERAGATQHRFDFADTSDGLRFESGDWNGPQNEPEMPEVPKVGEPEPHFLSPIPEPPPGSTVLSPSDLGGAKALPGDDARSEEEAMAHGTQVHKLLEHLPNHDPPHWAGLAQNLLGGSYPDALEEARATLTNPRLAHLFRSDALVEVPVTASLDELQGRRIHGVIDRLIVGDNHVLAVDFKTNAVVPADPQKVPEGVLRQMGAYAAALKNVFPDMQIKTAILWTRTGKYMPLPHDIVISALCRTTIP